MIRVNHVYAGYNGSTVLKNIDVEFEKGKIYTVIGTNGSGKSTLLRVLTNFLSPSAGFVTLDEINIKSYKLNEICKQITMLPQVRNIPDIISETLVSHGRFPHMGFMRKLNDEDYKYIDYAFKTMDIENLRYKNLKSLSGGERQKVFIAMALAQNTDIILLDEPTTYLDIHYQIEIMNLIKNLNKNGKTIIMVLHDLNHAIKFSDKICVLEKGELISFETPEKLVSKGTIDKSFKVKTKKIESDGNIYYFFE